jgi:hypothetical protein
MEHAKEQRPGGRPTLSRRLVLGDVGRAGSAAAVGLAAAAWPSLGRKDGRPAWPLPGTGVAEANDEWCDTDPIRLIITPEGSVVAVYYLTGVKGTLGLVGSLLSHLAVQHTAVPDNGGTMVTLSVTVPDGLLSDSYQTRLTCSSGALGTGTVYGSTEGTSGRAMQLAFRLNVP